MSTTEDDFTPFFAAHYPSVCRALWLAVGDGYDPEDAAQEAFARAFRKWRTIRRMDRPGTWVFVVAIREARRQERRRSNGSSTLLDESDRSDPTSSVDSRLMITTALNELPPRQRMAVVLRYYADLPVKDIARAMKCREGTISATIHAALVRLRTSPLADHTTTGVDHDEQ